MPSDQKKPAGLSYPTPPLSNIHSKPSKIAPENIIQALDAALEAGDDSGALKVLDGAPQWMKRQPEIMLIHSTVLMSLGDDLKALQILREIGRKHPRFTALHLPLSLFYMDQDWPAHALQAAKRALSNRNLTKEDRAILDKLVEEATNYIQDRATENGLSFETMGRACIFDEQAQMAMDENKLSEVEYFSKEAVKIAPNWNPPHNNLAFALFFSGKTTEAISVSEAVLVREVENVSAMRNLVNYHLGLNQPEKAWEYATRLGEMFKKFPANSLEIEEIIMALGMVEDTPTLWKIAKRYLEASSETLFDRSWQCLAVAAVRSGKWKDALRLIEKTNEKDLSGQGKKLLDELKVVAEQRQPSLAWMPPPYPGVDQFFHPKVLTEWEAITHGFNKEAMSPSKKRKLGNFFQKYPCMVAAMKRLLWEEDSCSMALQILMLMETSEADAEILRFALSKTGNCQARIKAMTILVQSGRYTGPKIVKIWHEDRQEWREMELSLQRIGNIEINARPQTLAFIEKAQQAKNPQEAIALLRKAVEKEPTSPMAVFNLGVILTQNGKIKEGEALIQRSVEIDPNYTYGHASIALTEAGMGHGWVALDHLEVVNQAEILAPDTAVIANLAWAVLAIQKHDLESARQRIDIAAQIAPEHRLLKRYKKMLQEAEDYAEKFGVLVELQLKGARRAHRKLLKTPLRAEMGLRDCLETSTRDMLVGSAHFLRTSSSGKKEKLVSWLAESLLDLEFLQETLDEDLGENEDEALKWMLETDGVRPWREFVHKYGDDMDESIAWNYHEPKSLPGRLRISGLLYAGTLNGRQVAFIPVDVRSLLRKLLK
jgi:tetratricopeptide (TPR) repeat protein